MSKANMLAFAKKYIGIKEGSQTHHDLIDVYNTLSPLPRGYKVKYTDAWCAAFVSACAILSGESTALPMECGCQEMINKAMAKGMWYAGGYIPVMGDIVMYDFTGKKMYAKHTGIVVDFDGCTIAVVEGNKSDAVGLRYIDCKDNDIMGYIHPNYTDNYVPAQPAKDVTAVAKEVIKGNYGNGDERRKKLEAEGYNYAEVQAVVNTMLSSQKEDKDEIDRVAREVIKGNYGNGDERRQRLAAAGYDYAKVQARVNQLLAE